MLKTSMYLVRPEVLLNNIVDKDFQYMLFPLNIMQYIFFCPKYLIQDSFITPNSKLLHVFSFYGTLLITMMIFSNIICNIFLNAKNSWTLVAYISTYFDTLLYSSGYILNYTVNLLHYQSNISFILKIQKVHKDLQVGSKKFKKMILGNWISVLSVVGFYSFVIFYFYVVLKHTSFKSNVSIIMLACFDTNMVYASRLMTLLTRNLAFLNRKLKCLSKNDENSGYDDCKLFFGAYQNILQAYEYYWSGFQEVMLYHTIETFTHALAYVQILIELNQKGIQISPVLIIFVWLLKNLFLQCLLSANCEQFYMLLNDSRATWTLYMTSSKCTEMERRICKNFNRLYRASFSKIRACCVYTVDATLPFKLISNVSTHTIILLQFAIL